VTVTKGHEVKITQAIRGTEERVIAKWEADGWQLVSHDQGTFRTALTFQRPRPKKSLTATVALASLLLVTVGGLTIGLISGDDETVTAPPTATASSPPADVATPPQPSAPAASTTTWGETQVADLGFGETARFRSTAGDNDIPLEISVGSPVSFTPSEDATVFDARTAVGGQEGELHETNVYFTVSIKNLSTSQAFSPDFVFSDVAETGADDQVSEVLEGDVVGMIGWPRMIAPGESFTLKDGYSVNDATAIEYTLNIDGLAGRSFSFSR
jgi:hypothetical protein